jgi:hypothetical protein
MNSNVVTSCHFCVLNSLQTYIDCTEPSSKSNRTPGLILGFTGHVLSAIQSEIMIISQFHFDGLKSYIEDFGFLHLSSLIMNALLLRTFLEGADL